MTPEAVMIIGYGALVIVSIWLPFLAAWKHGLLR